MDSNDLITLALAKKYTDEHGGGGGGMQRYIIKLVAITGGFKITDYDGNTLSFSTLLAKIKDTNNYVVMLYGNSKLRPQYVSTNEIMFTGLDRAQTSKVLRCVVTGTSISYWAFDLVEETELTTKLNNYQTKLTAGDGIKIENNVISLDVQSASGGSY